MRSAILIGLTVSGCLIAGACTLSRAGDDAGEGGGGVSTLVTVTTSASGGAGTTTTTSTGGAGGGGAATTGTMTSTSSAPPHCGGTCVPKAPTNWAVVDFGKMTTCASGEQHHAANACNGDASCTNCTTTQSVCDGFHLELYSDATCGTSIHEEDLDFGGPTDCIPHMTFSAYKLSSSASMPAECTADQPAEAAAFCDMPVLPIDDCGASNVCAPITAKACILSNATGPEMCDQLGYPNHRVVYIDAPAQCCECQVANASTCDAAMNGKIFTKDNCGFDTNHMPLTGITGDGVCHDINDTGYSGIEMDNAPTTAGSCTADFKPQGAFNVVCCAD